MQIVSLIILCSDVTAGNGKIKSVVLRPLLTEHFQLIQQIRYISFGIDERNEFISADPV